jgi:2-oxoglutarate dehydrogenase E1 component
MNTDLSFISNMHPAAIESMYESYVKNPEQIDPEFRKFFAGFDLAAAQGSPSSSNSNPKELKVYHLIESYRAFGHRNARTNPLPIENTNKIDLSLAAFGLNEQDLNTTFQVGKTLNIQDLSLKNILGQLEKTYTQSIGFEIDHVPTNEREWLLKKIEQEFPNNKMSLDKQKNILEALNKAVTFEQFLGKKYVGEKRFSLEGGENTISSLEAILEISPDFGIQEIIIGMAHRGRLNVLANILQKSYNDIFSEFEGIDTSLQGGDGDVKYHKGFKSLRKTKTNKDIYIELLANPSHLEAVNPVVMGFSRAIADNNFDSDYGKVLPILIHGDAAIAGQGIGLETAQMMNLRGFSVYGCIHMVINNQIGFTTDTIDAKSSLYCTAIANATASPVLHINGDDAEAVVWASELAVAYRKEFKKDIFLDLICYRKHGHNESDDPKYTQPKMYDLIAQKKDPLQVYEENLNKIGQLEKDMVKRIHQEFYNSLQNMLDEVKNSVKDYVYRPHEKEWFNIQKARAQDFEKSPNTYIPRFEIDQIIQAIHEIPSDLKISNKLRKQVDNWHKKIKETDTFDWQAGELLAYGSLLLDKHNIRFTGEDVKRGTFTHRHLSIRSEDETSEWNRLANIAKDQGKIHIYNSHLSEYGVLGYEFGYSIVSTNYLTIWEAQFGDFVNGAQIIIDQFICSSETKWNIASGLVLLLPHGYEGQGPEHSSARMERFLQSCAEFNMQVCNITTPANFFHAIRRQLKRNFRIPLVIMTPKSLLRHPLCVSKTEDFANAGFQEIIDDTSVKDPKDIKRVLFCSGKIYYELLEQREKFGRNHDVAIVRMEQLYPIAIEQLEQSYEKYKYSEIYWVQEEPANMGAWTYLLDRQYRMKGEVIMKVIARKTSSSPATGNKKQHIAEIEEIYNRCFNF